MIELEIITGTMLEIRSMGFFGHFSRSPDGSFIISWGRFFQTALPNRRQKGHVVMLRMGQQLSQHKIPRLGRLVEVISVSEHEQITQPIIAPEDEASRVVTTWEGELLWQKSIERPMNAKVSDTGHAVVSDWRSPGKLLQTFYAFDPQGSILIKQNVHSLVDKTSISDDSKLAWCSTSDNELMVFSLSPPERLLKAMRPPSEWEIKQVRTVGSNIEITTTGATYLYDSSGVLVNEQEIRELWYRYSSEHGRIYDVLAIVERCMDRCPPEKMPQEEVEWLLEGLQCVSIGGRSRPDPWGAKAQRMAGEIALARGDKERAVNHFRQALALDPKVGVAKLLRRLQRE